MDPNEKVQNYKNSESQSMNFQGYEISSIKMIGSLWTIAGCPIGTTSLDDLTAGLDDPVVLPDPTGKDIGEDDPQKFH